jgi:superfamily II DNA or RNA helicase
MEKCNYNFKFLETYEVKDYLVRLDATRLVRSWDKQEGIYYVEPIKYDEKKKKYFYVRIARTIIMASTVQHLNPNNLRISLVQNHRSRSYPSTFLLVHE